MHLLLPIFGEEMVDQKVLLKLFDALIMKATSLYFIRPIASVKR